MSTNRVDSRVPIPERSLMGEIRVKVLLTNAMDAALHRLKKLAKKKIRTYLADALVDTAAVL